MSLINEALKKAQKQRTGDAAPLPAIGGESAERIARRGKSSGFPIVPVGIGAAALALVVGGILFMRRTPAAEPTATTPPPPVAKSAEGPARAAEPAPAPVVPAATPVVVAPAPVTPPRIETPAVVAKVEPPPAPVPVPVVAAPAPAPVAAPPQAEPARPLTPGRLEPRAINYIEALRIAGIRASATDSKVLMNDRVYRIGSIVEADMGLKLTGITAHSLTFEDERGATYTRTF